MKIDFDYLIISIFISMLYLYLTYPKPMLIIKELNYSKHDL